MNRNLQRLYSFHKIFVSHRNKKPSIPTIRQYEIRKLSQEPVKEDEERAAEIMGISIPVTMKPDFEEG
jgi:hypothetical protein